MVLQSPVGSLTLNKAYISCSVKAEVQSSSIQRHSFFHILTYLKLLVFFFFVLQLMVCRGLTGSILFSFGVVHRIRVNIPPVGLLEAVKYKNHDTYLMIS